MKLSAHFFREGDDPALADQVFRFRHDLFCVQHGWSLYVKDDLERDDYDTADTVHCALMSGNEVACYFRAIRCDRLYFSARVFPHLAVNHPFPSDTDYWDISRFGVAHDYRYLSTFIYGLLFRFAVGQDVKGLVCILTPARQRQLKRIGLAMRRYGPPLAIGINSGGEAEIAMACEVPMSEQNFSILRPMIDLTRHMEIKDETFLFRLERPRARSA